MEKISSPFARREMIIHPQYVVSEDDIVEYVRQDVLKEHDPDDPAKFVTEETIVEKSRVNRQEYINSFREDVGIKNILKKLALTGDTSVLNQIPRAAMPIDQEDPEKREVVQDFTALSEGETSAAALGDKAMSLYKSLPQELLKGRSYEEFIRTVNDQEINDWIASLKTNQGGSNNE